MSINLLRGNPLDITITRTFNWKEFRKKFRYFRKALESQQGEFEESALQEAAIKIVRLCRAAVAFLAAIKDFPSVQTIMDEFDLWSNLIVEAVAGKSVSLDLINVPESEVLPIKTTVGEITMPIESAESITAIEEEETIQTSFKYRTKEIVPVAKDALLFFLVEPEPSAIYHQSNYGNLNSIILSMYFKGDAGKTSTNGGNNET